MKIPPQAYAYTYSFSECFRAMVQRIEAFVAEQAQSGTLYQSGNPYLTAKAVKCFESVSVYLNTFFWHKQSWSSTSESSSWAAVLLSMLKLSKLGCTALKRNHSPCTGTSRIDLFSLLKKYYLFTTTQCKQPVLWPVKNCWGGGWGQFCGRWDGDVAEPHWAALRAKVSAFVCGLKQIY